MVLLARHEDPGTNHPCRDERFRRGVTYPVSGEQRVMSCEPDIPAHKLTPASGENTSMNILLIHNSYQQPGGEDVVVGQESKLLEQHGHRVHIYQRSNKE